MDDTNKHTQSTVVDPALTITRKLKPEAPRVYRSADASDKGVPHIPGTMKIVVGAGSTYQRTWELPKATLSRHSLTFEYIIATDPTVSEVQLPTISLHAFANFVLFLQSSIYSPNTQVAGYRSLRAHADSCLLAAKLQADDYWEAAMRQLYSLFEPLARSIRSDAKQSFIRASDIKYICDNTMDENLRRAVTISSSPVTTNNVSSAQTQPTSEGTLPDAPPPRKGYHSHAFGAMKGLRTLFFDALASHWTQYDVVYIGAQDSPRGGGFNKNDVLGDTTTWREVCDTYPDFSAHMTQTKSRNNAWRGRLLRHIGVYLDPADPNFFEQEHEDDGSGSSVTIKIEDVDKIKMEEDDKIMTEEDEDEEEELELEKATGHPKLWLKLRGFKRSYSEESTEVSDEVLGNVKKESEESIKVEENTVEDRVAEGEEMTEGMDAGIEEEETFAGC